MSMVVSVSRAKTKSIPGSTDDSLSSEHLESFKPQDTDYARRQADAQIKGVQPVEPEEVPQEGHIKDQAQEKERATHYPPQGCIRRS